jgi:hypothetical protein
MNRTALQTALHLTIAAVLMVATGVPSFAQGGRGAAPRTAKDVAPIDVTGYWESRIVDEWRFRVTPQKGDLAWIQITADARKAAMARQDAHHLERSLHLENGFRYGDANAPGPFCESPGRRRSGELAGQFDGYLADARKRVDLYG